MMLDLVIIPPDSASLFLPGYMGTNVGTHKAEQQKSMSVQVLTHLLQCLSWAPNTSQARDPIDRVLPGISSRRDLIENRAKALRQAAIAEFAANALMAGLSRSGRPVRRFDDHGPGLERP